jgi:hypothetical protein
VSLFLMDNIAPEVEEEEDDPHLWCETQHQCPCCQEMLVYTDEIFLLEVTQAAQDGGQILTEPLLGIDGDYQFEPYMLHFQCWEEMQEQIQDMVRDQPPMECEDGILYCSCCKSTIGNFEPFVAVTFGEIQVSQRTPNGEPADKMLRLAPMDPVCLACIVNVFEENFDDWEELFADFNIGMEEDEDE